MEFIYARPAKNQFQEQIIELLTHLGLRWDKKCEMSIGIIEGEELVATGSRQGNILKCIGVLPDRHGEGLTAAIVTELIKDAHKCNHSHLFLFTKPNNIKVFRGLGFYPIAATEDVALLENVRDGIGTFIRSLEQPNQDKMNGAIVANCNPFTNGHLYLIEEAAKQCDILHLFILSEDKSLFPAKDRMHLAKTATDHLSNVIVHPTGPYMISSATFPDYFMKDKGYAQEANCRLDIAIFAKCFAKHINIQKRFVGTEPNCAVTSSYNLQMSTELPQYGIEYVEINRLECLEKPISASLVRKRLECGELESVRDLVPPSTYTYLEELRKL